MKQKMKQWLGALLSIALILGLMPGMSLTAYADDPYANLKNTTTEITFDSKSWYLIDYDATTVTLLAKECVGDSQYNSSQSFVGYSFNPTVKTAVDNWYNNNITEAAQTAVSGDGMFLLTREQAEAITNAEVRKCSGTTYDYWWLCSPGEDVTGESDIRAAFVNRKSGDVSARGDLVNLTLGVRPALKLNLSSVILSSDSKTISLEPAGYSVSITPGSNMTKTAGSGAASQTGLSGAMTSVVYTANDGYYFPEDYSVATVNGISVTRDSSTQITVSGTPTEDAEITLTEPTVKTNQAAPAAPVVTATTADSITVKTVRGVEFSIDGVHWQTSGVFTGLEPDTTYVIQARKPETESHAASPASKTVVNTPAAQSQPGGTWSLGLRILNALNIINSSRQTATRWNPWSVRTIWTPWWVRR